MKWPVVLVKFKMKTGAAVIVTVGTESQVSVMVKFRMKPQEGQEDYILMTAKYL